MPLDIENVKKQSEALVIQSGGQVCDWLPCIEQTTLRKPNAVLARALIMNAMLNLYFGAPTEVVRLWINKHGLTNELSSEEANILSQSADALTEQVKLNLYWYIEGLWALMWAIQVVPVMDFTTSIPESMAAMCPSLRNDEGPEKFSKAMRLRDYNELYKERDLYYRVMWWARQCQMTGHKTQAFGMSRILERRRALEWIMDDTLDWDDVPLDT